MHIVRNGHHYLLERGVLTPVQVFPGGKYRPFPSAEVSDTEVIEKALEKATIVEKKKEQFDIGSEMDKILARIQGNVKSKKK